MKYVLYAMIAIVAVGCSSIEINMRVDKNNANMANLSIGMTKAQVIEVMGPAGKTEGYATKSGGFMEFLFYRSAVHHGYEDGPIGDKHWTPVCLIDGKLKGWGRNFYDDTIKIRKEVIQK
jgi:hypothetical protein